MVIHNNLFFFFGWGKGDYKLINIISDVKSSSSLSDEPPSIYSSVSSSSSTTSSATTDDDLAQELESMWKLKTNVHAKKEPMKQDINSEEMLMQLLISHAMIDAREYKVLTFEEFESLKQVSYIIIKKMKSKCQFNFVVCVASRTVKKQS